MKRLKNATNLQCKIVLQYMISRIVLILEKKILQYIAIPIYWCIPNTNNVCCGVRRDY